MLADFAVAGISMGAFFGLGVTVGGIAFLSGVGLIGYGLYHYYIKPEPAAQQIVASVPEENNDNQVQHSPGKTTAELIAELSALPAAPTHTVTSQLIAELNALPAAPTHNPSRTTAAVNQQVTSQLIAKSNSSQAATPIARKAAAINPQPAQASVLKQFTNVVSSAFSGFFSGSRKSNPMPHREFGLRRTL